MMSLEIDKERLRAACEKATRTLLDARCPEGHWEGRLSSSALSTATAVGALAFVGHQSSAPDPRTQELVEGGLRWLADKVNDDGGWGDTDLSFSNISTTTLCWAAFGMAGADERFPGIVKGAEAWLTKAAGGVEPGKLAPAIVRRYGKDKTFSVPILTMCVISGRMGQGREAWKWVKQLPFELAAFPHKFFAVLRLPVVSYALPALIAIGQARHARRPSRNPLARIFRNAVRDKTLEKLKSIQPESGGFLEAAPLTSFVAMSLAAAGQVGHPVTAKCVEFLAENVREDGSWPIDTNLATWVTTLAINALGNDPEFKFEEKEFGPVRDWILDQQYKDVHPYTNAAPGGWAWTNLTGGVPDADDTAGALLALLKLDEENECVREAVRKGVEWLIGLQNGNGGIPTFCRGWTKLPFDRSSPDITAHVIRAIERSYRVWWDGGIEGARQDSWMKRVIGMAGYLSRAQKADGSWIPLWFGNQHHPNEENPIYGTGKGVLALTCPSLVMFAMMKQFETILSAPPKAVGFLKSRQASDGGSRCADGAPCSVEESALSLEALAAWAERAAQDPGIDRDLSFAIERGSNWLIEQVESGEWTQPSPIGFYFAKLWYYEELYPIVFTVAALNRVKALLGRLELEAAEVDSED